MHYCCIEWCRSNAKSENISLFRFPNVHVKCSATDREILLKRREAWLRAVKLKRVDANADIRICSKHFKSGMSDLFYL
jgi:hypothetical protein